MSAKRALRPEIFSGWKDIASYLGRSVRTVQRYEQGLGMPIHRPNGKAKGSVIATKADLDAWVAAGPTQTRLVPQTTSVLRQPLEEFHRNVAQLHRLRSELAEARAAANEKLESLRASIQFTVTTNHAESLSKRDLGDGIGVDPKKVN